MKKLGSCLLVLAGVAAAQNHAPMRIRDGDRIVFYGDSITDQRLYTVITETYLVTRYPNLNLTFVHSGWGGDKVSGGGGGPIDVRLQRDVIPYRPTVISIMLGMNDGLYRAESNETDKLFQDGYRHIVDTMRSALPDVRITAIEPSPFDDVTRPPAFPGGYNSVLLSFSKWIEGYAKQANLATADLNSGVVEMLKKANEIDPVNAQKIIPDRIHPAFAGHLVMAEQLLKAWNAQRTVAAVTIDASGAQPKLEAAEHTQVLQVKEANGIEWNETDDALPLPFMQWQQGSAATLVGLVLKSSDVTDVLNAEPLRITGLRAGSYVLKIDGEADGTFTNEDFQRGVNLAILDTPMSRQAKEVYDLTVARCNIHNDRWRTMQVPLMKYELPELSPAMTGADALAEAVAHKRRELSQPKTHSFSVSPAT